MPGVYYQPVGRREFLKRSTQALAACAVFSSVSGSSSHAAAADKPLHLALLSDTHVAADLKTEFRKSLPAENLKLAISQATQGRPDAALVNGDLARLTGELEDYQAVKGLLSPVAEQCPVYLGMGNHDNRDNFHKVFTATAGAAQKITDKQVLVVEESFLRLIVLDSLLYVNKVPGLLGKAQRDWLDNYLASCDGRPTVLFVHHTLGDGDGELLDAEALHHIIQPYSKVKAVFYGHSHEYNFRQRQGIHLVNLPAVGYNFSDKEPVGWVDAFFSPGGVDLTLKALGGNREKDGKTTSLAWRSA